MTALARRLALALPTEPASPPAWRGHAAADPVLREVLGVGRLTAAIELRDERRTDELLDQLLAHPWLGRRLAGRVWAAMGDAITAEGPPPS